MAVLYRKYRPQTFADVVDQKYIVQTLQNQVKTGAVSHAYLFTGSRGVGKTSLARIFAKAVNCPNATAGQPDGTCAVCSQIENGTFIDLVEIDAASNTGVDNIRDLIEHVKFSPSQAAYKVFIIDEVHMLSKGAFNALLKTLEEPPRHAIFILATTEAHKVPATIISRTQRFDFHKLSHSELVALMERIVKKEGMEMPPQALELVATHAEGGGRDALSLLDKVASLGGGFSFADVQRLLGVTDEASLRVLYDLIVGGNTAGVPEFFESLSQRGADPQIFNRDFLEFLRVRLVRAAEGVESSQSVPQLVFLSRLFIKSYKDLAVSPDPQIALLVAALEGAEKFRQPAASAAAPPAHAARETVKKTETADSPKSIPPLAEFAFTHVLEPQAVTVSDEDERAEYDSKTGYSEVCAAWQGIVSELKKVNGPLATLVKNSPVQEVQGGIVTLGVKYLFHKQNLENRKNTKIICEIMERVLGKKLGVRGKIITAHAAEDKPDIASGLAEALSILGGEVVE